MANYMEPIKRQRSIEESDRDEGWEFKFSMHKYGIWFDVYTLDGAIRARFGWLPHEYVSCRKIDDKEYLKSFFWRDIFENLNGGC
jgi:hypothetical protein